MVIIILEKIAQIDKIRNENLNIATLQNTTVNLLGFRCKAELFIIKKKG